MVEVRVMKTKISFVILFALSLVNNKKIMGEHTNPRGYNVIAWATVVSIIVLATAMVVTTIAPLG